jgi:hypothetical protein
MQPPVDACMHAAALYGIFDAYARASTYYVKHIINVNIYMNDRTMNIYIHITGALPVYM